MGNLSIFCLNLIFSLLPPFLRWACGSVGLSCQLGPSPDSLAQSAPNTGQQNTGKVVNTLKFWAVDFGLLILGWSICKSLIKISRGQGQLLPLPLSARDRMGVIFCFLLLCPIYFHPFLKGRTSPYYLTFKNSLFSVKLCHALCSIFPHVFPLKLHRTPRYSDCTWKE